MDLTYQFGELWYLEQGCAINPRTGVILNSTTPSTHTDTQTTHPRLPPDPPSPQLATRPPTSTPLPAVQTDYLLGTRDSPASSNKARETVVAELVLVWAPLLRPALTRA